MLYQSTPSVGQARITFRAGSSHAKVAYLLQATRGLNLEQEGAIPR